MNESISSAISFKAAIMVVVAIAVLLSFIYFGIGLPWSPGPGSISVDDRYCQEEFGEAYQYGGYIAANPPTMMCKGPDGKRGYMDMPEEVANKYGMYAAAYNDSGGA